MNMDTHPTILITSYDNFKFGKSADSEIPYDTYKYIPLFGIGDIVETKIYCMTTRPLKISAHALKFYGLTDPLAIPLLKANKVGVIRRTVKNNIKIDEYYCQQCTLIDILYEQNFGRSYATVSYKNSNNETVQEDINITRICIPKLLDINTY